MFEDLDEVLPEYSKITGFEDSDTKEEKDLSVAQELISRASQFRNLQDQPGWKYLEESLKTLKETLLNELTYSEDTRRIRKLQAIIQVLKIFPKYIEHVFIDEQKALEILEGSEK